LVAVHVRLAVSPLNCMLQSDDPQKALKAANIKMQLKRKAIRFGHAPDKDLFYVIDGGKTHYFGHLQRGSGLYGLGLASRAKRVFDSYLLHRVTFDENDIVIDCGANYGDLWLSLQGEIAPKNYITFEPSEAEHRSVCANAPDGLHNKKGLSDVAEVKTFYLNEKDADSSLVEPNEYSGVIEVETVTLSSFVEEKGIEKIKLFKLEAEGFEPEIMDGTMAILDKIEYIAIDGGNERGKEQEETFSPLTNTLLAHGFKMVEVNLQWGRALFRNTKL
jgi:FkbM family methyltransferase